MSQNTEPTLKVTTLAVLCQLLLVASQRGAFSIDEFSRVGATYDELAAYTKYHLPEAFPSQSTKDVEEKNDDGQTDFFEILDAGDLGSGDESFTIGVVLGEDGKIDSFEPITEPENIVQVDFSKKGDTPDAA